MNHEFLEEARDEFWEAVMYYEARVPGLGLRFRLEVEDVIRRILAHPLLPRERPGGFRRVNCPVFSYYVAYFLRGDKVLIAAVAHGHRKPGYWKNRKKNP